jgi:hypothetical protein
LKLHRTDKEVEGREVVAVLWMKEGVKYMKAAFANTVSKYDLRAVDCQLRAHNLWTEPTVYCGGTKRLRPG